MEELFQQLVDDGLEELEIFSDSDNDDDMYGHPDHTPLEVLENLKAGYKYHKNGPAREYFWTKDHVKIMTEMIQEKAALIKSQSKKERQIRGQDFQGNSDPDHLLKWVNRCLVGKQFPYNPSIERGPALKRHQWSNKKLWHYVSRALIAEYDYWTAQHKRNQNLDPQNTKYPDIRNLIFRHNDDFTSGLWSEFSEHWERFINEMRYIPFNLSLDNFISAPIVTLGIKQKYWRVLKKVLILLDVKSTYRPKRQLCGERFWAVRLRFIANL